MSKLGEKILPTIALYSNRIGAATVLYNGVALSDLTVGHGIDTKDYDSAMFVLNVGNVLGASAALNAAVYECATDTPLLSTLVTGASFTAASASAMTNQIQTGLVKTKATKRYLWLRTATTGAPLTVDVSGVCVLGMADSLPTPTGDQVFDV